ncbi:hypothetical protein AGOR_G00062720 [Albula goreensis]|uniref:Dynein heavy chain n=1 Tax=Albula goreensis TaxID=1534307 RepID=A0A8T3DXY7_9TELE|nr:hypothetical protein AGOR_G00062720 [Albula goreensis]
MVQLIDYRAEFSRWWSKEMRAVKFPSQGTVFDYFIDPDTKKFAPWSDKTPSFELEPDIPLQTVLVHSAESICLTYFVDLLLQKGKPVMLVGNAGVGKTILVSDKVSKLREDYMVAKIPFNYYTTSAMLQLHFPGMEALATIYSSILGAHFQQGGFSYGVTRSVGTLVQAAICLHQKMTQNFLPTAIRFHYIFNLRDLSNIFQGIDESIFIHQPLIYCHFAHGVGEPHYFPVSDWEKLHKTLTDALEHYNELHAVMNLVLFEEAMQHICRISRILEAPHGNALLIGVGGSGKQSLCRLAAFLSVLEVFQITLRKGYGIHDLRSDIAALYLKVGVKNIGTVFLHTDAQIPDERFLVLINDMLASGDIPDLFSEEEVDMVISSIRMELRGLGLLDTRENCWQFFIDRIRRQLKPEVKASISEFISYAHTSVNEVSAKYQQNEKHYNYTTPKSFLEFIKLYGNLLSKKRRELTQKMERLENGLQKLQSTAYQVSTSPPSCSETEEQKCERD